MQLPSSTYTANYGQSQPLNSSTNNSRIERTTTTETPTKSSQSTPAKPAANESAPASQSSFAAPQQPNASEFNQQQLLTREAQAESTGNRGTDQYRQIASEGEQNAQAQDPSLFRVDVYV